ncbi:hypothetical protein IGI04_026152 [Brassica rapa subsp. trilocularis]|uniref:Uncharacterized protein n=1 Tax=Brassica rapa subsp. trilocularis TaxID=1813537 RepID=A0ABQ7KXV9_BRACM|nr:hypothetical protein IGI04_026152 [Brassica rapa subsp. trilocularis]
METTMRIHLNPRKNMLVLVEAIPKLGIAFREPVVGAGHDCPRMCKSYFKRNGMTGVSLSVINKELGSKVVLEWEAQGKVVEVEEAESQGKGKRKKTQKSVGKGKKQKTNILELKGHFTRADHLEVDERKNNRSMRISADDRYQEIPRQMKINIDQCTQVPSIDVETPDTTFWTQQT